MKVLGLSDGVIGGAALVEDGEILHVVNEERLTRDKMAIGFPRQSIECVLSRTGTDPSEIDTIAVASLNEFFREPAVRYDGWLLPDRRPFKDTLLNLSSAVSRVAGPNPLLRRGYYGMKALLGRRRRRAIERCLARDWGTTVPVEFVEHHHAHACSAYYTSGLDEATVITLDGAGDNVCSHVYRARGGSLQRIWSVDSVDSIGNYYAYVTHLCGFTAHKHEGKITGLAARGEPHYADLLERFIGFEGGTLRNHRGVFYRAAVEALRRALPRDFRREDLAASMQCQLERACRAYVAHWAERVGCPDLALAGGVFANVKLNQRVHELEVVRSLFVHPGMGDEGLSLGAALAVSAQRGAIAGREPSRLRDVYLGPAYDVRDIDAAIARRGLRAEVVPDMARRVAELLAQGYVVARFAGAMEYGPRALGNRSILYRPTDPTVNDWLNQRLRRTEFMPFAPVTLAEYADQCFEGLDGARDAAEFMTITFDCTPWMKQHCPAVVHVDGTARPQLVTRDANPACHAIVDEFRKITGLPSLINTSFNMHEEPIVCTPDDAIRAFLDSGLDFLALEDRLLRYEGRGRREPS